MGRGGNAPQAWDDEDVLNHQKECPQNNNNQGQKGWVLIPQFENWGAGSFADAFNAKMGLHKHKREMPWTKRKGGTARNSNGASKMGRGGAALREWDDDAVLNECQAAMPQFGDWNAGGFTVVFDAKRDTRKQERHEVPRFSTLLYAVPDEQCSTAEQVQKDGAAGSIGHEWKEKPLTESEERRGGASTEKAEEG